MENKVELKTEIPGGKEEGKNYGYGNGDWERTAKEGGGNFEMYYQSNRQTCFKGRV